MGYTRAIGSAKWEDFEHFLLGFVAWETLSYQFYSAIAADLFKQKNENILLNVTAKFL